MSLKAALGNLKTAIDTRGPLRGSTELVVHRGVRTRPEEIVEILGRLCLHYPVAELTEKQQELRWSDYIRDLRRFSRGEIEAMCARWRQSPERFFPTPGQLLQMRWR